jgi:hypothetical protein
MSKFFNKAPQVGPTLANEPRLDTPAPAVQAPQELTADSFGPVAFPGLQQQGMDTRLQVAGEEQQRMNELSRVKTDAMVADARSSSFFDKTKEVGLGGKFSPILDLADQQRFGVEKPLPEGTLPAQLLKGAGLASDTLDAMGETAVDFTKGAGRVAQNIGEYFTGKDFNKDGGVVPTPAAPVAPVAASPAEVVPEVMGTPESIADLSVNGKDVVTPEAITEAAPAAPVEAPSASTGGMITRDSTGESFIGGSPTAATPEEVAAFGTDATTRREALETKIAAENPQITQAEGTAANMAANTAAQGAKSGAPVRQTTQERDSSEKSRAKTLRKEGQNSINEQMREFNREPHTAKERTAEKARLQGELKASIKEDRNFNRATSEANFAKDTAEYNRNTLTAAQQNVSDRGDAALESANERKDAEIAQGTFERQNMATAAIQGAVQNLSLIEGVSEDIKAATMKNLTEGNFARAAAIISPTSTAAQIERMTETLAGDAFVDSILELKRMGGTVGQVSNAEGGKLTAAKQKLMTPGMGDDERRAAVENYLQVKRQSVQNLHNAFVREFGPKAAAEAFGGSAGGGAGNQPRYPDDVDDGTPLDSLILPKSK